MRTRENGGRMYSTAGSSYCTVYHCGRMYSTARKMQEKSGNRCVKIHPRKTLIVRFFILPKCHFRQRQLNHFGNVINQKNPVFKRALHPRHREEQQNFQLQTWASWII
jgi:hypothetical protein